MSTARYRISRRLGQGGMAEVFEAEAVGELGFARKVAIKRMLSDAAADPSAAKRFLDEARIASRLHHANIVAVTDVGLLDGLPFQVLEFVDGINAQQLQQRAGGTLPLEIALIIAGDVAHALDHAHRAADDAGVPLGFVHRDVKPSNVLVSWGGDVKLADFGIALARDREARTETGIVAGTMGFIAPEQRTRSEVDGRADVFALGLTLHALLTGYTPLRDITAEMELLEGKPLTLDASLPADVKDAIARAVAPSRLDRPTAAEFASTIGELLAPRLRRDARGYLRAYLERLGDRAPQRGALDALLGIEVVAEHDGDVPQYRTVAVEPPTVPTPPRVEPQTGRRRGALFAAIALLAAAGGGLAVWRLSSSRTTVAPDANHLTTTLAPDANHLTTTVAPDAHHVITPTIDARSEPIDAAASPIDAPRAPIDASSDARVRVTVDPTRIDAPPAVVETGWLQVVGGEELVNARVIVDGGKWKFFVPHKHEVAVGVHRIEVIKPDGTKLPAKTVEITTFHTRQKAARVEY